MPFPGRVSLLLSVLTAAACSSMTHDSDFAHVPPTCGQVVVVRALPGAPTQAVVQACVRRDGRWIVVPPTWPAVVGRSGIVAAARKREGDGGTPVGVHAIGPAFGAAPTCATRLRYRQATARDWWIDDPTSPAYNTWVTRDREPAVSAEAMARTDGQYELGAVLGWNTDPVVAGRGSAIFLHVWKGPDEPTSGCVALARADVAALLAWLDPAAGPCLVVVAPDVDD